MKVSALKSKPNFISLNTGSPVYQVYLKAERTYRHQNKQRYMFTWISKIFCSSPAIVRHFFFLSGITSMSPNFMVNLTQSWCLQEEEKKEKIYFCFQTQQNTTQKKIPHIYILFLLSKITVTYTGRVVKRVVMAKKIFSLCIIEALPELSFDRTAK